MTASRTSAPRSAASRKEFPRMTRAATASKAVVFTAVWISVSRVARVGGPWNESIRTLAIRSWMQQLLIDVDIKATRAVHEVCSFTLDLPGGLEWEEN